MSVLFSSHPPKERYQLSSGTICQVPYYCRDCDILLLHGLVDYQAVGNVLTGQNYLPVRTSSGSGIATLWVVNYRDTTCGPYRELILSFVASQTMLSVPFAVPLDLVAAFAHPEAVTFVQQLHLNSRVPIEYGREVHGIPKALQPARFSSEIALTRCSFRVDVDGNAAAAGNIGLPQGESAYIAIDLKFVTPVAGNQTVNVLHCELAPLFRDIDAADVLAFSADTQFGAMMQTLRFTPQLVQFCPQSRFVMPKPLNWLALEA